MVGRPGIAPGSQGLKGPPSLFKVYDPGNGGLGENRTHISPVKSRDSVSLSYQPESGRCARTRTENHHLMGVPRYYCATQREMEPADGIAPSITRLPTEVTAVCE